MTTILCQYDGALRCRAVHGPSGSSRSWASWPGGRACCSRGCTARVEKTMTNAGLRRIERLTVWVAQPAGLTDDQVQLLRRAAEGCPVKRSLEGAVAMELRWETL